MSERTRWFVAELATGAILFFIGMVTSGLIIERTKRVQVCPEPVCSIRSCAESPLVRPGPHEMTYKDSVEFLDQELRWRTDDLGTCLDNLPDGSFQTLEWMTPELRESKRTRR